jgi:hypothetical protein
MLTSRTLRRGLAGAVAIAALTASSASAAHHPVPVPAHAQDPRTHDHRIHTSSLAGTTGNALRGPKAVTVRHDDPGSGVPWWTVGLGVAVAGGVGAAAVGRRRSRVAA